MNRIDDKFASLRAAGEKALVCFVTAGDPNLETTRGIVLALEQGGADVVELGVPFSDPMADGPSIQASSMRALEAGTSISDVLKLVQSIRKDSQIPLVLMSYYNPVYKYGLNRFAGEASGSGVDGVIVTDIIPEEAEEWKAEADRVSLNTVFLLAPTSTDSRIEGVASVGSGFIYCVSRTGVTGTRAVLASGIRELVAEIRKKTDLPICVGFGISKPEHVREVGEYADGAVVGSVLVDLIARKGESGDLYKELRELVSTLKAGTR